MRKVSLITITIVLVTSGLAALTSVSCEGEVAAIGGEVMREFGVSMMTDKAVYSPGEPIAMTLKVFNHTGEEVTFGFRNSQRYDFTITDEGGNRVWLWSDGMMFLQALGEEKVGPGREELTYMEKFADRLETGRYVISGTLVDKDKPMSGSVTILVK